MISTALGVRRRMLWGSFNRSRTRITARPPPFMRDSLPAGGLRPYRKGGRTPWALSKGFELHPILSSLQDFSCRKDFIFQVLASQFR
jgi:hypothetical protein